MKDNLASQPRLLYRFALILVFPSLGYGLLAVIVILLRLAHSDTFWDTLVKLPMIIVSVTLNLAVGILIIRRAKGNVTGPLLILFGISILSWLIQGGTTIPIEDAIEPFVGTFTFWVILCLIVFFPTGRAYFRRAETLIEAVAILYIVGAYLGFLVYPVRQLPNSNITFPNPTYIAALSPLQSLTNVISASSFPILLLVGIVSIIPRYRGSNQRERQQMKWLAVGFSGFVIGLILWLAVGVDTAVFGSAFLLWCYLFPAIAVGNAILRHKLYDIDIIIRRTLIYAILSAILAGVYFGTVIFVQQVFQSATGEVPDFAIVLSTLLIAALFNPICKRVQAQIDRRFYRRKYDVEQTLAEFQQNLREEVDMPTLQANLVTVVNETMQPSSIRLWVKGSKS